MNWFRFRLTILIIALIAAFIYRFPVEIQKFGIEAKALLTKILQRAQEDDSLKEGDKAEAKPEVVVVTLKNKGQITGIIEESKEAEQKLIMNIGFGVIEIGQSEVEAIAPLPAEEKKQFLDKWCMGPGNSNVAEIRYQDRNRIIIRTVLNEKVTTALILDTGAPYVAITPEIGRQLFDLDTMISKNVDMEWTDGSVTAGKLVLLESITVGNVRVNNVKAVVAEIPVLDQGTGGLLGMSYLRNFSVNIDAGRQKLILEKK